MSMYVIQAEAKPCGLDPNEIHISYSTFYGHTDDHDDESSSSD